MDCHQKVMIIAEPCVAGKTTRLSECLFSEPIFERTSDPEEDPDMVLSEDAPRRAAKRAHEEGLRTHTPVYVWRDGRIVDLTAEAGGVREPEG